MRPARHSTPGIQTAVSRLCRCMQQPSYKAWTAALQVLQWLYHHREEGITFRSDGNQQLRCYYDSGQIVANGCYPEGTQDCRQDSEYAKKIKAESDEWAAAGIGTDWFGDDDKKD